VPTQRGVVCIHIGTHKTGTKALQLFLSDNRPLLNDHGIYLPHAGQLRVANGVTPGHHGIAVELLYGSAPVSLEGLAGEIAASGAPVAVVSSEVFQFLCDRRDALVRMQDALAAIGYGVHVVVYLRDQARYAESLYAEYAKRSRMAPFDRYNDAILETGRVSLPDLHTEVPRFDYGQLLRPFVETFGREHVSVRPYRPDLGPRHLFTDFLTIAGALRGGLHVSGLVVTQLTPNERLSLLGALQGIYANANAAGAPDPETLLRERFPEIDDALLHAPFSPLTHPDAERYVERFAASNAAVEAEHGISIPFTRIAEFPFPDDPKWARAQHQAAILRAALEAWGLA
jgi:hypothetical protein